MNLNIDFNVFFSSTNLPCIITHSQSEWVYVAVPMGTLLYKQLRCCCFTSSIFHSLVLQTTFYPRLGLDYKIWLMQITLIWYPNWVRALFTSNFNYQSTFSALSCSPLVDIQILPAQAGIYLIQQCETNPGWIFMICNYHASQTIIPYINMAEVFWNEE